MGSSDTGSPGAETGASDLAGEGQPAEPPQASSSDRTESGSSRASIWKRIRGALSPAARDALLESAGVSPAPAAQASAAPQHGIANLRRLRIDDVAIPKVEIAAVPLDIGRDDLVEMFRKHGYSRLPVYKGTLDHPQGLVLLKDLALTHGFGAAGRFSLKKLLRPVLYAPPSMPVGVLLQKMQRERVHMALVIDEYGGVDGLVTIEDLIETVIGEIEDEHDEAEDLAWKEERPGVFVAKATAPLDELETATGLRLRVGEDDGEIDTVGGLVFLRTGRVPARGECVPHESGAEFEVIDADARRIKRLRLRLPGVAALTPAPAASKPATDPPRRAASA